MKMTKKEPKKVLVFSARKVLIAICASALQTSRLTGIPTCSITRACNGVSISAGGFYFRYLDPDIFLTDGDLGDLDLLEYDRDTHVHRKVYRDQKMTKITFPKFLPSFRN